MICLPKLQPIAVKRTSQSRAIPPRQFAARWKVWRCFIDADCQKLKPLLTARFGYWTSSVEEVRIRCSINSRQMPPDGPSLPGLRKQPQLVTSSCRLLPWASCPLCKPREILSEGHSTSLRLNQQTAIDGKRPTRDSPSFAPALDIFVFPKSEKARLAQASLATINLLSAVRIGAAPTGLPN